MQLVILSAAKNLKLGTGQNPAQQVLTKCKSKCVSLITLLLLISISGIPVTEAQKSNELKLTTPKGVRLLKNKSFDDSKQARKEILELYKNLRVTDVLDGMDLIALQDIGLMDKNIRPLWRDVEKFSHRVIGFAVTVRHVPTARRDRDSGIEFPSNQPLRVF